MIVNEFSDYVATERWLAGANLPGLKDEELDEAFRAAAHAGLVELFALDNRTGTADSCGKGQPL